MPKLLLQHRVADRIHWREKMEFSECISINPFNPQYLMEQQFYMKLGYSGEVLIVTIHLVRKQQKEIFRVFILFPQSSPINNQDQESSGSIKTAENS